MRGNNLRDNNCYAVFERSGLVADGWRSLATLEKDDLCHQFNVFPV